MATVNAFCVRKKFMDLVESIPHEDMAQFTIWLDFKLAEYKCQMQGNFTPDDIFKMHYPKWINDSIQQHLITFLHGSPNHKDIVNCKQEDDDYDKCESHAYFRKRRGESYSEYSSNGSISSFEAKTSFQSTVNSIPSSTSFHIENNCHIISDERIPKSEESEIICLGETDIDEARYSSFIVEEESIRPTGDISDCREITDSFNNSKKRTCKYKCPVCRKIYYSTMEMRSHLRSSHGLNCVVPILDEDGLTVTGHQCSFCNKVCRQNGNLWTHVLDVHCEGLYICEVCGKIHHSAGSLWLHRRKSHGPDISTVCQRSPNT